MAERVNITDTNGNNLNRRSRDIRGIDVDFLREYMDTTIYELIPTPPPLPSVPPVKGVFENALWVANWGMLADFGGSTNQEKDIGADWVRRWAHDYPARFGVNPVYRFFHGDSPLFYIYNPVSYYDPETGEAKQPDKIVWKIDGQVVHTGRFLQLYNVEPTEARKLLSVEVQNSAGTLVQNLSYEISNSDEHGFEENFSSEYEGFYVYDPAVDDGKGKAIFKEDPRFTPRRVKFKIKWNDYGNGKNRKRKFKKRKPTITIDGVSVVNNLQDIDGNIITVDNGNDVQDIDFYIDQPPGPAEIRVYTKFNFSKGFKRMVRIFEKKYTFDIDLDSSLEDTINLGTISVGKRDEKR